MYRTDIFAVLKRSPESSTSHNLVTASSQFGLTVGGYRSKQISLDDIGRQIVIDGDPQAKVDAVLHVGLFKKFFEQYAEAPVPGDVPAKSFLAQNNVPPARTEACLAILIQSGRDSGLIQKIGEQERIVSAERATKGSIPAGQSSQQEVTVPPRIQESPMLPVHSMVQSKMPSINFNIELHLPSDATAETYDAIFSSLRKHLIDVGE